MNEEETINILEDMLEKAGKLYEEDFYTLVEDKHMWAVRGLLELYKQEKEKNKKLEEEKEVFKRSYEIVMEEKANDYFLMSDVMGLMAEDIMHLCDFVYDTLENARPSIPYKKGKNEIKEYYFKKARNAIKEYYF